MYAATFLVRDLISTPAENMAPGVFFFWELFLPYFFGEKNHAAEARTKALPTTN
jgi:hypothetical protein